MNQYIYRNMDTNGVVFQCFAESITVADTIFHQITGKHPARMPVGCSINFNVPEERAKTNVLY